MSRASFRNKIAGPTLLSIAVLAGCRLITGTGDLVVSAQASGSGGQGGAGDVSSSDTTSGTGGASTATTGPSASSTSIASVGPGASSSSGGMPVMDCNQYCADMGALCTGGQAQYDPAHPEDCTNYCPYVQMQDPDQFGDSLVCRSGYLPPSALDCNAAGPTGATDCGSPCVNFCSLAIYLCNAWPNLQTCLPVCNGWPDSNLKTFKAPVAPADTLACRYYWLTRVASTSTMYCPALGDPSDTCK